MQAEAKKFRMLKAYRELKNINQKTLAELISVGQNTYSFKENGKTPFTLDEAKTISDYFKCTIEDIFFSDSDHKMNTGSTA